MNHRDALTVEEQENNRETTTITEAAAVAAAEVLVTDGRQKESLGSPFFYSLKIKIIKL